METHKSSLLGICHSSLSAPLSQLLNGSDVIGNSKLASRR
jgi:hypothetical protein